MAKTRENPKKTKDDPKKKEVRKESRVRDIVMLVVIAFAVLMMVSLFSPAVPWLKTASYFVFGIVMYAAPLLIVVLLLAILYHKKTSSFFRRLIACVIFLFALSGIFSFAINVKAGGLLGRLNYAAFHSWLGKAGAYVVNALLIAISLVLFIDFSVFSFMESKRRIAEERRKERIALRKQESIELENEEARRRMQAEQDAKNKKAEQDALKEYNRVKGEKADENRERFKPKYGIGNTLITNDDPDVNTTFYQGNDALETNANLFGKYKNSGMKPETPGNDTEFIPKISFASDRSDDSVVAGPVNADPEEEYTKIVVTSGGKVHNIDRESDSRKGSRASSSETTDALAEKKAAAQASQALNFTAGDREPKKEYKVPPMTLMERSKPNTGKKEEIRQELARNKEILENTCAIFNVPVTVTNISCGPSVTRYEVQPGQGIKVSRVQALQDDIKLALAATDIRIEAPIPGKPAIGIEVPNKAKTGVMLRDILESPEYRESTSKLAFGLGMDIDGHIIVSDLQKMPHLLVAGTTGSGKSVCLNTMIISILYHAKPTEVKMILIDPKVIEFSGYNGIPHLLLPVVTAPKKASMALSWAVQEMEKRYDLFETYGVRNIESYNQYIENEEPEDEAGNPVKPMPFILIVVDEFADLMMVAKKEVEDSIIRLAQKARAAGIHLVLATQSPRVDVITGIIKANIPSKIALSVSSGIESRLILDMNGAESLLGHGDMLYAPATASKPVRVQGAYVSDAEIKSVVKYVIDEGHVRGGGVTNVDLSVQQKSDQSGSGSDDGDDLFESCGRIIIETQKASIGMLQRKFSIGFNRAARIMDQLAEAGVVGEEEGTKPRRILMSMAEFEAYLARK